MILLSIALIPFHQYASFDETIFFIEKKKSCSFLLFLVENRTAQRIIYFLCNSNKCFFLRTFQTFFNTLPLLSFVKKRGYCLLQLFDGVHLLSLRSFPTLREKNRKTSEGRRDCRVLRGSVSISKLRAIPRESKS